MEEDESDRVDGDSVMSDYEDPDEPDYSMTLDQYQTGIRKETLVRRITQHTYSAPKKGRLDNCVCVLGGGEGDAAHGLGPSS